MGIELKQIVWISSPYCSLRMNRFVNKINLQTIFPQQMSSNEDLSTRNKGGFCSNRPVIKWKIDQIDLFFDDLTSSQSRQHPTDKYRIQSLLQILG